MAIDILEITGLRGFVTQQNLRFARPNGRIGGGLTVLVGSNNSGKTTVIEALRAFVQRELPSFSQGRRNRKAGDYVRLRLQNTENGIVELRSVLAGTSETERINEIQPVDTSKIFVLPSRRTFNPYFGRSESTRNDYMAQIGFPAIRTSSLEPFAYRLFRAQKNRNAFNAVLAKVISPVPDWTIDQSDSGQYFLKFRVGDVSHSSEGLGEGLVSLFFIVDSLYDSEPGDTIVIDEPELSLHPLFQRKLANLLTEYASTLQIVLATHSPYFVNLVALENGATVARIYLRDGGSRISQLSELATHRIARLLGDLNNPHIFGLNAQEAFFLEDHVILVEGQEDVIFYQRILDNLGISLEGTFFGWGVGGADKMEWIALILRDLGFEKVVGILDGNKAHLLEQLRTAIPQFRFFAIPAQDVRTKEAKLAKEPVVGLLDNRNESIRPEHLSETRALFDDINNFLTSPAA